MDYLHNICVRMCLVLHFAIRYAMLFIDMEAGDQISQYPERYCVSQVRACYFPIYFNLFLRIGYKVKEG